MATVERESRLCLGRDEELAQLREALTAARAGRGRLLLVTGEASA